MIVIEAGWIPLVEAGKLRLLATYGKKRSKVFPKVPTVKELGYKVVHNNLMVILGPKEWILRWSKFFKTLSTKLRMIPLFIEAMGKYDMPIMYMGAKECTKYWADAYIKAGEHVKKFMLNK